MTEPLHLERVMTLVAAAMESAMSGEDRQSAGQQLVARYSPSERELAAARRENFEVHGGGTPSVLRDLGMAASPPPPEVLRLRQAIDEVLVEAAYRVADN